MNALTRKFGMATKDWTINYVARLYRRSPAHLSSEKCTKTLHQVLDKPPLNKLHEAIPR